MSKTPKKNVKRQPPKENKKLTCGIVGCPIKGKIELVNKPTKEK